MIVYSRDVIYRRVAFRQKDAITPKIYYSFTVHAVGTTDFGLISTWGVINNMKYDVYIQHDMMLEGNNSCFHTHEDSAFFPDFYYFYFHRKTCRDTNFIGYRRMTHVGKFFIVME